MIRLSYLPLLLLLSPAWLSAQVAQEFRSESLSQLDRRFMEDQRSRVDDLARFNLGRQLNGDRDHDLAILQDLLDRRLVRAGQTLELQAMGVVLGDLLAEELGMTWVVYQDQLGRSRALHMPTTEHYLFPVTMISRRVEVGAPVAMQNIYDKAYQLMLPHKPRLPFQ